ncbi:NHL repeat protein [Bacteriovorax sp. BAL6_X]|uniref:NHL repeat protein n=1 Tax=Bacteriovorax sp. BAL6_X TaxID=1201290 RepID=UPI00038647AD|nr:NHL repeat protein [Bacteriovorax sp. BAL6_X]EPZ49566.1 NHL repeat protein [Bacteriovorax sp. BAL6_X]
MRKFKIIQLIFFITLIHGLTSCEEVESVIKAEPLPAPSGNYLEPGDIIVMNYTADSIVQLDSNGVFKRTIYQVTGNSVLLLALGWSNEKNQLLFTTDGNDRVLGVNAYTGKVSDVIVHSGLNGSLRGVTELVNGNIAVLESNNLELFTPLGDGHQRETSGFPITNIISTGQGMAPLADGGFLISSRGSDQIRTYDEDGVQQNSVGSPAGANDGYFAIELDNGDIVGIWNGTTDQVVEYDSSLSATGASYSNTTYLTNPRGVAQLHSGNIIVSDYSYNHLVEIDISDYSLVRTIGQGLSGPTHVLVVPDY